MSTTFHYSADHADGTMNREPNPPRVLQVDAETHERNTRHVAAFMGDCGNQNCIPCNENAMRFEHLFTE